MNQDDVMDAILRLWLGDDYANADKAIREVAGYRVPSAEDQPFVDFIRWINSRPAFIVEWRNDPELEAKSYLRFMNGIASSRDGYAAASYHAARLREIELAVRGILETYDFGKTFAKGTTATIGSLERCNFEYQAFVMAYRRSLDHFAWGLSTYFKQQQTSFRKFSEQLSDKYHPQSVAKALALVCDNNAASFKFVMDKERGVSVRDRLAHKEAVQAGTINVGSFGHQIIGGGENLGLRSFDEIPKLADVVDNRLLNLRTFFAEALGSFRGAVNQHEQAFPRQG